MVNSRQLSFYVNQDNCVGCRGCEVACKQQWKVDMGVRYRIVHILEGGKYPAPVVNNLSLACNHCEEPACVEACPVKRIEKREKDGLVIYNDVTLNKDGTLDHSNHTCIFCGLCAMACPYGVPKPNAEPADGAKRRYEKCIGCWPRIDKGLKPACVQTCPGLALEMNLLAENDKRPQISKQVAGFPDPTKTKPTTRFKPAKKTSPDLAEVFNI